MSAILYKDELIGGTRDPFPVGAILPYASNTKIPVGFMTCDGQDVSRTMFPNLFEAIGTTYGEGDGETTFNLPNLNDNRFLEGSNIAGTSHEAGLPNIEGKSGGARSDSGLYKDGAFSTQATTQSSLGISVSGMSSAQYPLVLDASQSNPIYGASDTVQPKSITVRYIIKAFNAATTDSALVDMTQVANDLASKADRSLSNLNATGEARFAHVVVDSYYDSTTGDWWREYADGWVEQGGFVVTSTEETKTVSLLKPYADTNYMVVKSCGTTSSSPYGSGLKAGYETAFSKTTTTFQTICDSRYGIGNVWVACGMGATEE